MLRKTITFRGAAIVTILTFALAGFTQASVFAKSNPAGSGTSAHSAQIDRDDQACAQSSASGQSGSMAKSNAAMSTSSRSISGKNSLSLSSRKSDRDDWSSSTPSKSSSSKQSSDKDELSSRMSSQTDKSLGDDSPCSQQSSKGPSTDLDAACRTGSSSAGNNRLNNGANSNGSIGTAAGQSATTKNLVTAKTGANGLTAKGSSSTGMNSSNNASGSTSSLSGKNSTSRLSEPDCDNQSSKSSSQRSDRDDQASNMADRDNLASCNSSTSGSISTANKGLWVIGSPMFGQNQQGNLKFANRFLGQLFGTRIPVLNGQSRSAFSSDRDDLSSNCATNGKTSSGQSRSASDVDSCAMIPVGSNSNGQLGNGTGNSSSSQSASGSAMSAQSNNHSEPDCDNARSTSGQSGNARQNGEQRNASSSTSGLDRDDRLCPMTSSGSNSMSNGQSTNGSIGTASGKSATGSSMSGQNTVSGRSDCDKEAAGSTSGQSGKLTNAQRSAQAVAAYRAFVSNVLSRAKLGQSNARFNQSAAFRAYLFFVISNLQSYIATHGGFTVSNLQNFFRSPSGFNTFLTTLFR